ncbi:MAG: hypothetical protein KDB62_04785 [Solirubrobacterales bacterium]|nr:hypothetical protein [Solirubrobacterales bacterium]
MTRRPRVAVVGHVEWLEIARVGQVPRQGEIVHARASMHEVGGGGAVAAVQLSRLAGECDFFTALGNDELGRRAKARLEALGVHVLAAERPEPQRRAFVFTDDQAERTITVIGERIGPKRDDPLPWEDLAEVDAVYFTAGDVDAVRAARRAHRLVATPRAIDVLAEAAAGIDVLVSSAGDPGEQYHPGDLEPPPGIVARTAGAEGGTLTGSDGRTGSWNAAPLPGRPVDSYGAGDSFAAGLTWGLALGRSADEAAAIGARCGAACMAGHGPYEGQLHGPVG